MTKLTSTIWFSQNLIADRVVNGLTKAASILGLTAEFVVGETTIPVTTDAWISIYSQFKSYDYTGEAVWRMVGQHDELKGKFFWPIRNPGNLPGTVEFDFLWKVKKKKKTFVFNDSSQLVQFLHAMSSAVSADSLLVEPSSLPPEIVESRYERFRKLVGKKTISNLDWMFGLKSTSAQISDFDSVADLVYLKSEHDGFILFVLSPEPLNYRCEEDLELLRTAESRLGL